MKAQTLRQWHQDMTAKLAALREEFPGTNRYFDGVETMLKRLKDDVRPRHPAWTVTQTAPPPQKTMTLEQCMEALRCLVGQYYAGVDVDAYMASVRGERGETHYPPSRGEEEEQPHDID